MKDGNDIEAIKKANEELSQEMQKIGAAMQQQSGDAPGTEGNVRDAEVEEKGEGEEKKE